jgi:hypothetical protein
MTTEHEDKQVTKKQLKRAACWGFLIMLLCADVWLDYSMPEGLAKATLIIALFIAAIFIFRTSVKRASAKSDTRNSKQPTVE